MPLKNLASGLRKKIRRCREIGLRATVKRAGHRFVSLCGGLTREDVAAVHAELETLHREIEFLGRGQMAIMAASDTPLADGPLVSVIMPVWNRDDVVSRAVESLVAQSYVNWELLVVDDGSTDSTGVILERYLGDARIRLIRQPHAGVSAARNRALSEARGDLIAYLDSDNTWYPYYLSTVVRTLAAHPGHLCVYLAQLVEIGAAGGHRVRFRTFDKHLLREENYIDLNVFAHHRSLYDRHGGFDDTLTRLVDWDLIIRYTTESTPISLAVIGGSYGCLRSDSVTQCEPLWSNLYRVRRKLEQPGDHAFRVLYAVWHYPQLTETYIRWEIACMRRWGVEIQLWAEMGAGPAWCEPDVPVHYGTLSEAIESFRPHVVHVHWLNLIPKYRDAVARAGLQLTGRGHGFDFSPELIAGLDQDPVVSALYIYPHLARQLSGLRKVRPMNASFNGDLFYPGVAKNRRMVLKAGAALRAKELETFVDIAEKCPDHSFVLILGLAAGNEEYADELVAYNRSRGGPVDIRVNRTNEEVAALVREAGIWLHTFGKKGTFGMPVAIGEALATGAYVLARCRPGTTEYLGAAGAVFETPVEAAALIRDTLTWDDERWRQVQGTAVEHAYQHYADSFVLRPILNDWRRITQHLTRLDIAPGPYNPRFAELVDYLFAQGMDRWRHHDGALTAHQTMIGRILESWGCDIDVCLAGVVHSIYGTERGGTGYDFSRRDELRAIIGERGERLAYYNCVMRRGAFDEAVARGVAPYRLVNRHNQEAFGICLRDFDDLCRIHLADWLEQVSRCGRWDERRKSYQAIARRLGGVALATFERIYGLDESSRDEASAHLLVESETFVVPNLSVYQHNV